MKLELHKLRVNIKSLTAEAAIIRREAAKTNNLDNRSSLQNHRIQVVRPEARLAYLAYGFLRGKNRSYVESTHRDDPHDLHIELNKKIKRFKWCNPTNEEILAWLQT